MQRPEFGPIIRLVNAAWPQTLGWPTSQWDTWYAELERYPASLVEYVLRAATSRDFPPSPFDVAATCSEHVRRWNRQAALRAGVSAW